MPSYEAKTKTWRADITLGNKRYRKRGFLLKKNAELYEQQLRYKYERNELGLPVVDQEEIDNIFVLYLEYVQECKKENSYLSEKRALKRWQEFFQKKHIVNVSEIEPGTWDDFKTYRKTHFNPPPKTRTLNLDLMAAKQAFEFGIKKGYIHSNPLKNAEYYKQKKPDLPRYLTTEEISEIENLAKKKSPYFYPCFFVLVRTGLRVSELCSLTARNIDLERNQIILFSEQTKAGQMRNVPFDAKVKQVLQKLLEQTKENNRAYLFCTRTGTQQNRHNIYRRFQTLIKVLEKQGKISNAKEIEVHTLHRSYISHMIMAGVDPIKVMQIVGHRYWDTMRCYLVLSPKYIAENIDVLPY